MKLVQFAVVMAALMLLTPARALAGYGVQPNGQTISVTTDSYGYISQPQTLGMLVYLDAADSGAAVRVSTSPTWTSYGSPTGSLDGFCASFRAWTEPYKYTCAIDTIVLKPGVTYYWWMSFWRRDPGESFESFRVSGPFNFTLQKTAPVATPPVATPPATSEPAAPTAPVSTKSKESAAMLPSQPRWTGARSIKHTTVTDAIYQTMKALKLPRTLAVACWTNDDFESVLEAEGDTGEHGDSFTTGVWFRAQPRWLHLRGTECTNLQRLIDTKAATGKGAAGLALALHETLHAYGFRNEAQVNCFAVQLVPYAASHLGLPWSRALYAGQLAVNYVRRSAPSRYWNYGNCHDGGIWDLASSRRNLG